MKLIDHLKATDETVEAFAERLGMAKSTIVKIAYGQRQPSLPLAVRIEDATKGAVTCADMVLAEGVAA
jgi:DNA-binding transcriptional regulator YdaS (Cro superfamily)